MTRSTVSARPVVAPSPSESKAAIIADFRASMGELKCITSERLVRQGISMSQLHVMHLLESHGEMPMSRLAEMLDVSDSNATGLIDRVEERGFVERIRVAADRRMVMVGLTPTGRQLLDEIETVREGILGQVLDQLKPSQLNGVATALRDLREAVAATLTEGDAHHHAHVTPGRN